MNSDAFWAKGAGTVSLGDTDRLLPACQLCPRHRTLVGGKPRQTPAVSSRQQANLRLRGCSTHSSRAFLRSRLPSVPQVHCAQNPWLRKWGLHTAIMFRVWRVRNGLQPLFLFVPRRTRLAAMSPISEDAQKEGRCQESMVHRVHKVSPCVLEREPRGGLRILEGAAPCPIGWPSNVIPGAAGLLLCCWWQGWCWRAACPQPVNLLQLWLQSSGGLEPRPPTRTPANRTAPVPLDPSLTLHVPRIWAQKFSVHL